MVDVEPVIVTMLKTVAGITFLTADRIYTRLPASPAFPAIRVQVVASNEPQRTWQPRAPRVERQTVQIDCWGGSRAEAKTLAQLTQANLSGRLVGACAGGAVAGVTWDQLADAPDDQVPTSTGRARNRFIISATIVLSHHD